MSSYSTIKLEADGEIPLITLNRPEKRNAISATMIDELLAALGDVELGSPRVAIVTGAGQAFCAGMDLEALKALATQSPEQNLADARRTAGFFRRLWSFPKPLIAAVNGAALAGGCGIATLCDFTLAASEATFGYTEVRVGFMPALVSMFLDRQVGEKLARDLFLTGRILDAAAAQAIGLVTKVVPAEQLLSAARELAATLIANSPGGLLATKRLLVRASEAEIDRRIELAVAESVAIRATPDFREGLAAFLEKRKPRWAGSGSQKR
jgi:methylglutaconyl-CoA hydratase